VRGGEFAGFGVRSSMNRCLQCSDGEENIEGVVVMLGDVVLK